MTATARFHPVPQNPQNPENPCTVTVNLPSSPSHRSWLTRRNIVIGGIFGIGITAATVTAYLLSANSGSSVFTGATTPFVNQSSLSLYNITQLVKTEPDYYANCNNAFQTHLEIFKICGKTLCSCIRNARDAFELHCLDYAKNILKPPEECKEAELSIQRCLEREC